jgi:hypothetical protein
MRHAAGKFRYPDHSNARRRHSQDESSTGIYNGARADATMENPPFDDLRIFAGKWED